MSAIELVARLQRNHPRVTVVGDFLLDGWWSGRIDRIAREAPAPVVDLAERRDAPGGAANTAVNLSALGAEVSAVGAVGADAAAESLRSGLSDAGVDVSRLRRVPGAHTTTKVRVSVDEQVLVRLDETQSAEWPEEARERLVADVGDAIARGDAVLICDYGSAVLDDGVVAELARLPRAPLVIVDAHDPTRWSALRPDLVTPNAAEAERVLDDALGEGEERAGRAAAKAAILLDRTGAEAAIVTLDRSGTVLLGRDRAPFRTHAHPAPERHASGAGDVFVAALTAARSAGARLEAAAEFAQQAADVAVRAPGTCVCSLGDLEAWLGRPADPALPLDRLAERLAEHRRAGDRIVLTNGCFDVLHRGHTSSLRQAKRLGDVLVVALNSDASARRLKGPGRPVNDARDRASVIAELSCVDYVTVFDDDTACAVIRRLEPDVYAKGGDYTPEMLPETAEMRRLGGDVVMLDYVREHSTSEMLGRIRARSDAASERPAAAPLPARAGSGAPSAPTAGEAESR